jgi:hypothetical protein
MGLEVAITFAVLLSVWLFGSLWARRPSWTLVDLFLLAIALYFGVYTVIDATTVGNSQLDGLAAFTVFLLITSGSIILWWFARCPPKPFHETALVRLQADWRTCTASPIIVLIALGVGYRWYTSLVFGEYQALGERELAILEQDLPYWYTSLGMIVSTTIFPAAICSWGKAAIARGAHKLFWLSMTAAGALVTVGMGRRAILTFLIIVAWTILAEQQKKGRRWVSITLLVISIPLLVTFSNLYQAYRLVSHRGIPMENIIAVDEIGSLIENAAAVDRTVSNLQERLAMWRFNHEVIDAHVSDKADLQWGQIFASDLPNYVPSALYPGKTWVDSEETLLDAFGLEKHDRPSNLFSYTYADFGLLSAFVAPALMLFFVWVCSLTLRRMRDPFLRLLLMGMAIFYAMNLETGYIVPLGLARDFVLVALLYVSLRWASQSVRSLARSAARNVHSRA